MNKILAQAAEAKNEDDEQDDEDIEDAFADYAPVERMTAAEDKIEILERRLTRAEHVLYEFCTDAYKLSCVSSHIRGT